MNLISCPPKSGSRWSRLAGSRSKQGLFCTKSSVRGISVIKTRWSLTTEIINNTFYCIALLLRMLFPPLLCWGSGTINEMVILNLQP